MSIDHRFLKKGEYLAPVYKTIDLKPLTVGITEYPFETKTGVWHYHEKALMSFVLEGGNLERRKNKEIERTTGSINFYHSYELHQNIYKVFPSKHFSIEIDSSFLWDYDIEETDIEVAIENKPFFKLLFIKILKEIIIEKEVGSESVEMLFLDLVSVNKVKSKIMGKKPSWVKIVEELLNDNWDIFPSLKELSRAANVHPVTISSNFEQYFTCTYGEYMRKLKVDRAIDLIRNSKQSFTQIAYICGFSDQSHFTRVFKNQTGLLPSQYLKL